MLKIHVLLSTFNGSTYVAALLDSVLAQTGVDVAVLVRDDGSTDGTLALLDEYVGRGNVRVVAGDNVGAVHSFFWLLQHASSTADAVALADQDDVWLPDKLARGLHVLAGVGPDEPALYCSAQTLVDDTLRELGRTPVLRRPPAFENALVENVVTGCTAILNRAAVDAVARELPAHAHMHDWWLYQVISGLGRVVYDGESRILYRQHGANVVGASSSSVRRWLARLRRVAARRRATLPPTQLRELLRIHGARLPERRRALLERILRPHPLAERVALAFDPGVTCQTWWKSVALRWLFLFGRA